MAAQANRLATVADNIANSGTTGYKRASAEFASLILKSGQSEYISGSVDTNIRYSISEQGSFKFTTSGTDLGVSGNGFFVVSNNAGQTFLTRAGSFVPDGDGNLVNAAGFMLMGYAASGGVTVANGTAGLTAVSVGSLSLQSNPSSEASLAVNLPADAAVVAPANLPSANTAGAVFAGKTSLVAYDNLGNEVTLDVYSAKTAANTWEVTVYDRSAAGAGGGFPYSAGPLSSTSLTFDPTTGNLATGSPTSLSVAIPNGGTITLGMSQTSPACGRLHRLQGQRGRQRPEQGRPCRDLRRRLPLFGVRERRPGGQLSHSAGRCSKPRQPATARGQRLRDGHRIPATSRSASPRMADLERWSPARSSSRPSIWPPSSPT